MFSLVPLYAGVLLLGGAVEVLVPAPVLVPVAWQTAALEVLLHQVYQVLNKNLFIYLKSGNVEHQYFTRGTPLQVCEGEKDIGVHISSNLKPGKQCAEVARRANAILTQISKAFMYRDKRVFILTTPRIL